jgi:hypothetical protein
VAEARAQVARGLEQRVGQALEAGVDGHHHESRERWASAGGVAVAPVPDSDPAPDSAGASVFLDSLASSDMFWHPASP